MANRAFSLGGLGGGSNLCCCGSGPPFATCTPCNIPETDLVFEWSGLSGGSGSGPLIYSGGNWTMACQDTNGISSTCLSFFGTSMLYIQVTQFGCSFGGGLTLNFEYKLWCDSGCSSEFETGFIWANDGTSTPATVSSFTCTPFMLQWVGLGGPGGPTITIHE